MFDLIQVGGSDLVAEIILLLSTVGRLKKAGFTSRKWVPRVPVP